VCAVTARCGGAALRQPATLAGRAISALAAPCFTGPRRAHRERARSVSPPTFLAPIAPISSCRRLRRLCRFVMRGFDALRSLTRERIRPFDRRRSGLLLG